MTSSIIQWLVSALLIGLAAMLVPGIDVNVGGALLAALVLGLLNLFIKPIIVLLTLPINIITLGLFSLVINGALVLLAGMIVPGFSVLNFGWAIVFAIVLSLLNIFFNVGKDK